MPPESPSFFTLMHTLIRHQWPYKFKIAGSGPLSGLLLLIWRCRITQYEEYVPVNYLHVHEQVPALIVTFCPGFSFGDAELCNFCPGFSFGDAELHNMKNTCQSSTYMFMNSSGRHSCGRGASDTNSTMYMRGFTIHSVRLHVMHTARKDNYYCC